MCDTDHLDDSVLVQVGLVQAKVGEKDFSESVRSGVNECGGEPIVEFLLMSVWSMGVTTSLEREGGPCRGRVDIGGMPRRWTEGCVYKSSFWTMAIKSWSASRRWNLYRLKLRMALLMRFGVRGWLCLREATRARGLACCVVSLELRRTSNLRAQLFS